MDDAGCTPESLKADNRAYLTRFREAGEPVTLIDSDYAETVAELLDRLP